MDRTYVTIIPAFRISANIQPEARVFSEQESSLVINIIKNDKVVRKLQYELKDARKEISIYPDLKDIVGDIVLEFCFSNLNGKQIGSKKINYQIIDSGCNSTTLIDGCWVSIYHWSESEARWFNPDLKKLSNHDWKEQIFAMNRVGIKGIVIQNVFESDKYVNQHDMTVETYNGKAYYPSKLYNERCSITAEDPLEAILSAADEVGMNVLVGVGLYAWFDYSNESLKWHKEVTKELNRLYGHHSSLYGWYMSEEMFGSFYYDYPPVPDEKYKEVVNFFKEYKAFAQELTPTKPVALAPNNIRFHEYEKEWKEVLANVDILIPFAFARDPENMNIDEIAHICKTCGTHFWVDMEMFEYPFDNGLMPKLYDELIKEIRTYDKLEQIYGYQFTGIMNSPENKYNLGGQKSKNLYEEYSKYHKKVTHFERDNI